MLVLIYYLPGLIWELVTTSAMSSLNTTGSSKLDKLFKLFSKVELAQQTRFSSEMMYGRKFDRGKKDDTGDNGGIVDRGSDAEIDEID